MTFLNATLIFGLAATAVPIVLHLLARREPRKVVFPSVRFLTKRFESNRSRLQVRRWWLLALRIAALAALALALARPAIHRSLSLTWLTIGMVTALGIALLVMATVALSKGQSRTTTYASGRCCNGDSTGRDNLGNLHLRLRSHDCDRQHRTGLDCNRA